MDHLHTDCIATMAFGVVSIVLMILAFLGIDWFLRRVDLQAQVEKGNISAGIVSGAIFISISIVVHAVVMGVLK